MISPDPRRASDSGPLTYQLNIETTMCAKILKKPLNLISRNITHLRVDFYFFAFITF